MKPYMRQPCDVYGADAWQAIRSGWDGHVLVVATADGGAQVAAADQRKVLTLPQRALAATRRWVRLTSPLRCVRCIALHVASITANAPRR